MSIMWLFGPDMNNEEYINLREENETFQLLLILAFRKLHQSHTCIKMNKLPELERRQKKHFQPWKVCYVCVYVWFEACLNWKRH